MDVNEIPDKRKVFVGVDCKEGKIKIAFVNLHGMFLGGSLTYFPKDSAKFVEILKWTIRGLRGDVNLRMKNFVGIGISFANSGFQFEDDELQLTENIAVPVYIEDYEKVTQIGKDWLKFLDDSAKISEKTDLSTLYVEYGLVKLMKEKLSANLK